MKHFWPILLIALLGLLVFLTARHYDYPPGFFSYPDARDISPVVTSTTKEEPLQRVRVLFIGNSYTSGHDIPRQLVDIASSDPTNRVQITVQSVTQGGVDLKWHLDNGKAAEILRGSHWDYVVLQEQSGWALAPAYVTHAYESFLKFSDIAKPQGTQTLLFLTWPREPGTHWYTDKKFEIMGSPDEMAEGLKFQTVRIARTIGAKVADVGVYWQKTLKEAPGIELYAPDGSHPGPAGSFLAALVFYRQITTNDIGGVSFHPPGVSNADVEKIKAIVSTKPVPKG